MSDMVETFRAMDDVRKLLRAELGKPCPECQRLLPKAHPKILLPGGFCKTHRYTDPRPDSLIGNFYTRLSASQETAA